MATLRDHVQARKVGMTLSPVDVATYEQALQRTYDAMKPELWKTRVPSDEELVAVLQDRLEAHGKLTEDEYKKFRLLRIDIRRALALTVNTL